jgi:hypothetical protein
MVDGPVPAGKHAFVFIQPGKKSFNLPSSFVPSERSAVLCIRFASATAVGGNHFYSPLPESFIEWIRVIGTIPDKSSRLSQGEGLIEGSLDKGDLMR